MRRLPPQTPGLTVFYSSCYSFVPCSSTTYIYIYIYIYIWNDHGMIYPICDESGIKNRRLGWDDAHKLCSARMQTQLSDTSQCAVKEQEIIYDAVRASSPDGSSRAEVCRNPPTSAVIPPKNRVLQTISQLN